MVKSVKTYSLFLAVFGIVVSVVAGALMFPNWDSHAEIEMTFPKNTSEKISAYYEVNSDSLQMYQSAGNSSCRYNVYYQSRTGSYSLITSGLTFDKNDEWNGITYSLKSCRYNDVRFKVTKTQQQAVKSEIVLSLGQADD